MLGQLINSFTANAKATAMPNFHLSAEYSILHCMGALKNQRKCLQVLAMTCFQHKGRPLPVQFRVPQLVKIVGKHPLVFQKKRNQMLKIG
jgi:hypothetical protein